MSQLTFKFPFKTTYFKKDFYVSSNNFNVYRLIENWPKWPSKNINIYGPSGSGKTHLAFIFQEKINSLLVCSSDVDNTILEKIKDYQCIILDDFKENLNEKLLFTIINQSIQDNQYLLINSRLPIRNFNIKLKDLKSRFESFVDMGIDLPTDDLLRVILTKYFSDMQIKVDIKLLEYILKNIERSYEKVFQFIKEIDNESLSSGKSINIKLIKKVLTNE